MNANIWRETLFDYKRDAQFRGSVVLTDLQRRAFDSPKDYLQPVKKAFADNAADQLSQSTNPYATIFAGREEMLKGSLPAHDNPWYKLVSPSEWGKKVGIVMIAISVFGLLYTGLPVAIAEVGSNLNQISKDRVMSADPTESHVIEPSPSPLYPVLNDQSNFSADDLYRYKDFRIIIPKIGLESVIIKNVDPNNPQQYSEQLANGVAHALGSYLPGEDGTMFLFAHSTDTEFNIARYNAKFYAVRKLEVGDEILIRYGEKVYKYIVKDKKVISPGELAKVQQSGYKLVLSTCYPPGTDWQRLVVFADQMIDN